MAIQSYIYTDLAKLQDDALRERQRDLAEELEKTVAELSGRLIESSLECARLRETACKFAARLDEKDRRIYELEAALSKVQP